MNIQEAYNSWSVIYDTNINKTRDLEALALRVLLEDKHFANILEIGCGTGKNTEWLLTHSEQLIAIDFSSEMLNKAKQKIKAEHVQFIQADIQEKWNLKPVTFELITFSLVLEHIENLNFIFQQAHQVLQEKGLLYIGELHPFRQYQGTKAKFETANGILELTCFLHHTSEFCQIALRNGFEIVEVNEWFDRETNNEIPRILTLLFRKK